MKKVILTPFIVLSALGLTLSLIVHLTVLVDGRIPFSNYAMILHVGIFIVWIPAVLISLTTTAEFKRKDFWKAALRGCPSWMRKMTYIFFGYAILNFIIFIGSISPGKPVLESTELRGFSGHWMAFYSAAFSILYSATNISVTSSVRRCRNGHKTTSLTARFCEECGSPIKNEAANHGN